MPDISGNSFCLYNYALTFKGRPPNFKIFYNPENGRRKFLVSDYLSSEDVIRTWNIRWSIETPILD